jgi:uncharacterized protein (TIGR02001 family)
MTIKKTLIGAATVAALALAVAAAPAAADGYAVESAAAAPASDAREFSWSMTVGGTSDYVFRGLSFSDEDPAAQGSIDMSYGIFYAGAWASNLAGAAGPWELDVYAGIKPKWGPVTFDFGVIGYLYPAESAVLEQDYIELKALASMEIFKNLTGYVVYYYQIDNGGSYFDVGTYEGGLTYTLPQMGIFAPSLSGLVGYSDDYNGDGQFTTTGDGYTYWNAGLTLGVEKFSMDIRYWDTDLEQNATNLYNGLSDERVVFTAKVTLP